MFSPLALLPASWRYWLDDHATLLQRLLIIPAVLLVSFVLAPRSGSNITRLIVALPVV